MTKLTWMLITLQVPIKLDQGGKGSFLGMKESLNMGEEHLKCCLIILTVSTWGWLCETILLNENNKIATLLEWYYSSEASTRHFDLCFWKMPSSGMDFFHGYVDPTRLNSNWGVGGRRDCGSWIGNFSHNKGKWQVTISRDWREGSQPAADLPG